MEWGNPHFAVTPLASVGDDAGGWWSVASLHPWTESASCVFHNPSPVPGTHQPGRIDVNS